MCDWGEWWVILVFRIREFFLPQYFVLVFFAVNRYGDIVRESFSVKIDFTFFMIFASRLRFYKPFCFQCCLLCLFFVWLFFFSTDVNNTWITGHIHRSIVVKMEPTSEYVEMVKHSLSNTLGYIFLWNVIRSIYLPCLQLISKQILLINRDEYPTPVFTSTVE
jgi:hypothetical protein